MKTNGLSASSRDSRPESPGFSRGELQLDKLRARYKVPAWIGTPVAYVGLGYPEIGHIVGAGKGCLLVQIIGEKRPRAFHPKRHIVYDLNECTPASEVLSRREAILRDLQDDVLPVAVIAKSYGVSRNTVYKLRREQQLTASPTGGDPA